jgi:hypothetical protein
MLTFLNSLVLSVLAAALIPLLIHLFNKQRSKKNIIQQFKVFKKPGKTKVKKS